MLLDYSQPWRIDHSGLADTDWLELPYPGYDQPLLICPACAVLVADKQRHTDDHRAVADAIAHHVSYSQAR